jgi:hypothetical protein
MPNDAAEFRKSADVCSQRAKACRNEIEMILWIKLANAWLTLARQTEQSTKSPVGEKIENDAYLAQG